MQYKKTAEKSASRFWQHVWKKWVAGMLCAIFLFGAFGPSFSVFSGQWAEPTHAAEGDLSDITKKIGQAGAFMSGLLVPVIGVETALIGVLMDNKFVIGQGGVSSGGNVVDEIKKGTTTVKGSDGKEKTIGDIGILLNYVWQIVRNIVNYVFIVILIVIAFMVVATAGGGIGGGESSIQIGKVLPKFVIAVVAVNFTWFGAKVVLDAANIATNIVYSIPQSVGIKSIPEGCIDAWSADKAQKSESTDAEKPVCPMNLIGVDFFDTKKNLSKTEKGWSKGTGDKQLVYKTDLATFTYEWSNKWKYFSHTTFASYFAYSVLQIQSLPMSNGTDINWQQVSVQAVFAFVVMLLILIVFSIIFLVVLERVVVLWINIILSPIGVLVWMMKDVIPINIGSDDNNILGLESFLERAFIPAIMGIPLVFGAIMLMVGKSIEVENISFYDYKVDITGTNKILNTVNSIQALFWYIIAIVILWQSAGIAAKKTTFVKPAIEGIKQGVEGVGQFLIQAPAQLPWIPVRNKKGDDIPMAAADLFSMGKNLPDFHRQAQNKRFADIGWTGALGGGSDVSSNLQGISNVGVKNQLDTALRNQNRAIEMAKGLAKQTTSSDAINFLRNKGVSGITVQDLPQIAKGISNVAKNVYNDSNGTDSTQTAWSLAGNITINNPSDTAGIVSALKTAGHNDYNSAQRIIDELRNQRKINVDNSTLQSANWN